MIKCHLSTLMGKHKLNVLRLSEETGLNRSVITALYKEEAKRIDLSTVEKLCRYFECEIQDLFELVDEN